MGRRGKWQNEEMWAQAVTWRKGGLTYRDIEARLDSPENMKRFGLEEVPSEDTVRRQVKKRMAGALLPDSGRLAREQAIASHHDDLTRVAQSLCYNLQVPRPDDVFFHVAAEPELPEDVFERGKVAFEVTLRRFDPGPKYWFHEDEVRVGFLPENWPLFGGLMNHLQSTGLDARFRELKELLIRYGGLCWSLKGKVADHRLANVSEVSELRTKIEEVIESLCDELQVLIHRRVFPGRCRFCPQ